MNEALKNFSEEVAAQIIAKFASPEIRALVEETKGLSDGETGTFEVVITTENLDRYQEVIKLDGWDLTHYRANPIVLWGHDHNQPIGMATSIEITDGKMIAKGKFAPTEKAQEVRTLYDAGIIKATSVGFIEKEREGNLITKAELLEFSFVSVPANPYALTLAMEKDLNVNELVTKGFVFVEKSGEEEVTEPEEVVTEEEEATVEEPVQPEEKSFSTKQIEPVVSSIKTAIDALTAASVALEALGTKAVEPEGDETDVEVSEEEKQFAEFSVKRKLLQDAATVIGDILAESRQAILVKKGQ